MKKRSFGRILYPYSFISPAIIFFAALMVGPIIFSLIISLFNWVGVSPTPFKEFIGIQNFVNLFKDRYFLIATRNTIWFVIGTVILQNLYAYFLALLIFFGRFKFSNLIRSIIFFPTLIAVVVVGLVWRNILAADGIVNMIINTFGIDNVLWLQNYKTAMWVLILVNVWQWGGYNMVIFYAGLQSVDPQLVEAAMIDGASWPGIISKIVTPILRPTIIIAVILTALGGFKVFDLIYVLTSGGPAHQTEVLTTYIYYLAFSVYTPSKFSYSSAVIIFFVVFVIILSLLRLRFSHSKERMPPSEI